MGRLRKFLSAFLAAAILTLSIPAVEMSAAATKKAIMQGTSGIAESDFIYYGNYNGDDLKWRVLDNEKTNMNTKDGMFLLSEYLLDTVEYDDYYRDMNILMFILRFEHYSCTALERNGIISTNKGSEGDFVYEIDWYSSISDDKFFLLSAHEAASYLSPNSGDPSLKATTKAGTPDSWFLRSEAHWLKQGIAGRPIEGIGSFDPDGRICYWVVSARMRPACNLRKSSVLFTSPAVSGKNADGIKAIGSYSGNEWKTTIKDDGRNDFSAFGYMNNNVARIYYSGAKTGENEYISAIIADGTGYTHYGKLASSQNDGYINIDLSGVGDMTGKKLYIFNEKCNGDYKTDYSSSLIEVSLPNLSNPYEIVISNTLNGNVKQDNMFAEAGDTVTLTITPDYGFGLKTLQVNGDSGILTKVDDTTYTFVMPEENVTVTAEFEKVGYDVITVPVPELGGTVIADPPVAVIDDIVTLKAIPNDGYVFNNKWESSDVTIKDNSFTMPDKNVTVKAIFDKGYTIDIDDSITHGTVTADKTYADTGDIVTLTVDPNDYYYFDDTTLKMNGSSKNIMMINDTTYKFVMPSEAVTINASFAPIEYNITAVDDGNGHINAPARAAKDEVVTLEPVPNEGYEFLRWQSGDVIISNNKFTMPGNDVAVKAMFTKAPYFVNINYMKNGYVITDKYSAYMGDKVKFEAVPDEDYELADLTVTDEKGNAVTVTDNSFIMPASDVTITATFAKKTYSIIVESDGNGTASADKASASRGELVTLTATPKAGYVFDRWEAQDAAISGNTFVMPDKAVTVKAIFKEYKEPIPAKPVVTVENGNGQATLKWNAVSGATSYVIYQYNPTTNTYAQIVTTTGTTYTKTGLTNGSTYKFVVRAKNSSGLSPWTADDVVIANPAAPALAKPVITVTNGNGQATLKWNPVSGATSYVIYQYNPTTNTYAQIITTTGTSYTKTGLTNGTTYKFAVRAKNAYGMSPWTTADAVTAKPVAPAVPAKPVITVTNGNGQVTLKWNAVSGATSYVIYQYNPTTGTYETVITTTGTTYTKTGLTNGTTYKFAVRAKNSYGMSAWTTADAVTAKPVAPAVPAKPVITVTNGNGQVTLKWNAVSGATSYVIYQYNPTTGTYETVITTTGTTYTKTGLTNGTTYKFAVRAKNSYGMSAWTTADAVTAKPVAPAVPAKPVITVTNGNGQATLKWNPVSGATSYVVYQYNPTTNTYAQIITTTGTSYTKTGLTNGTTYKFAVRAKNSYGMSAWTTADAVTAKPVAPAVPAKPVITVTNGNGQATLKWNAVSGATSYVVYMYNASTGTYETVITTTGTTYTKTGLTNGTTYKFAVRAKNSYGMSAWTTADAVTAKPAVSSVPAKPAVKATAGNGSVTLSWNAVSGATKYYIYMYNTSTGTYQLLTTTTALTYTKTGLTNGTAYKFIVRAYNENGQSAYTAADAVSATPKA